MTMQLPENVNFILERLTAEGYEAFVVGGCVRDSLLGLEPKDWDITTSAKPDQVKKVFRRTIDTGIQHGTVTVMLAGEGYEVTTYRLDGDYEDSRHPKEVTFTTNLIEDLKRRDFTINAMAYNINGKLIDAFGGIEDIKGKVVRCVGIPEERFGEDALRILRAIRFSAQLGYRIEEKTKAAIGLMKEGLKKISAERIQAELVKTVISAHPDFLEMAYETGITAIILPEFDKAMLCENKKDHRHRTIGEHLLDSMNYVRPDKALRFTMLFHEIGKAEICLEKAATESEIGDYEKKSEEEAKKILKRLRFDNDTIDKVTRLIRYHNRSIPVTEKGIRYAIAEIGEDLFPYLLEVQRADLDSTGASDCKEQQRKIDEVENLYHIVIMKKQCTSLKSLAVTGNDLIQAGMKPGKEIGLMLKKLLITVLENPENNEKEKLLFEVKKWIKK